ncbi:MAG: orotidine-5'-phosphate decarboxylase [Bdellovibrionales bacterium]|nr:orotidine-5'-phosphate decarboxylase [Bdellovibrionales bacterium]
MQNPLFVALDLDDAHVAIEMARELKSLVGGFKVGPRLLIKHGEHLVQTLAKMSPVFVDNKYFDIPNTMESAVRATFEAGATFCTVHAQAGAEALSRLAVLEEKLNQQRPFKILCVTVLTSFSENTLPPTTMKIPIEEQVMSLAKLTVESGLSGLVCSPFEVNALKQTFPKSFLVTPGVRWGDFASDDQKRVKTPKEALSEGASALVIGRPIIHATDPKAVIKDIIESL